MNSNMRDSRSTIDEADAKDQPTSAAVVQAKQSRFKFPEWMIWYKKPEYRDFREYATAIRTGRRPMSRDGRDKSPIPARLSLEKVLANETCSPMSLYDFYMYLKYIEFSPENLEFFVWFRNYEAAYSKTGSLNNFPMGEKDVDGSSSRNSATDSTLESIGHKLPSIKLSEFECDPEAANETMTNIVQLIAPEAACRPNSKIGPTGRDRIKSWANACAKPACSNTAATVIPARIAPNSAYRVELNAVVKTFLLPDSEKELNIPPAMRDQALLDLQHSSDPAHLRPIADHVYGLLKNCSHRNFVRLGVSNGTFETLCMATSPIQRLRPVANVVRRITLTTVLSEESNGTIFSHFHFRLYFSKLPPLPTLIQDATRQPGPKGNKAEQRTPYRAWQGRGSRQWTAVIRGNIFGRPTDHSPNSTTDCCLLEKGPHHRNYPQELSNARTRPFGKPPSKIGMARTSSPLSRVDGAPCYGISAP
ncbi:hypothetical protein Cob_v010201 [Colletotrichum orbiculare MAFF 240422]|uniref:RGS domain-containing protein n=1 Tax=Colletotrichum orbiculare (strain 104-T / ATCC 96160 / CBS 514.97 / LARS 414 / MAFF 240422) TaxID=1213857 RepID=A0A484FFR1_COLOR|nr:hypothetical protein Cob_v010201 [Colletotrichum orbiculare MAFF 240422]